ncbi:hypothetical protein A2U01_0071240, partial [Trifolium medium]|nr:hypothetical protein [Trifolium medium]
GHTVPSSSSSHVHPPAPIITAAPSVVAPVVHPSYASVLVTGSSSAPTLPSPATPSVVAPAYASVLVTGSSSAPTLPSPATVSTEALTTEVEQKLSLQSALA